MAGIGLLSLLPALAAVSAEDRFPGIEALMSPEEFRATGLDKLSNEELEALDRWLIQYTARDSAVLLRNNEEVREVEEQLVIRARINPPFSGWSGETRFELDNGQVWRQRIRGRFTYDGEDSEVEIRKNFLGFYKMKHLATGKTVGVSRVE